MTLLCRCLLKARFAVSGTPLLSSLGQGKASSDVPAGTEAFPSHSDRSFCVLHIFNLNRIRPPSALQVVSPNPNEYLQIHLANLYLSVVAENAPCSASIHFLFLSWFHLAFLPHLIFYFQLLLHQGENFQWNVICSHWVEFPEKKITQLGLISFSLSVQLLLLNWDVKMMASSQ